MMMMLARRQMSSSSALKETVLNQWHKVNGGKMVEFCGWSMPLQYTSASVVQSVLHTRAPNATSLFDVSHMCQWSFRGKGRIRALENLVPTSVGSVALGSGSYSALLNSQGGIVDDCVFGVQPDEVYVVTNAGRADVVSALFRDIDARHDDVDIVSLNDAGESLVALQGDGAEQTLCALLDGGDAVRESVRSLRFMQSPAGVRVSVAGVAGCRVTRCGYTGEDGFEVAMPNGGAERLADALCCADGVLPAGLAARDILRLEALLCLYGNDIDETTTPVDANLQFIVDKQKAATAGAFAGQAVVGDQLANKTHERRRVGISVDGAGVARVGERTL
jgi:glycine cleavage system T protein (aminomethyltransferase)